MTESDNSIDDRDSLAALQRLGEVGYLTAETRAVLHGIESSGVIGWGAAQWDNVCARLSQNQQSDLFRGLVIAERDIGFAGGSVSVTTVLFKRISDAMPLEDAYRLALWAAQTSHNVYTPISSINAHSILRSFGEYMLNSGFRTFSEAYASAVVAFEREKRAASRRRQEEAQRSADDRRSQKVAANQEKKSRQHDMTLQREAQIRHAAALPLSERLRWLASTTLPLPAIPVDLFEIAELDDKKITNESLEELIIKLQGHRGHWAKLCDRLKSSIHSPGSVKRRDSDDV